MKHPALYDNFICMINFGTDFVYLKTSQFDITFCILGM